jgi:Holliday junction resolvase RusA-like endonuclease
METSLIIVIPMLPPSVNHYLEHPTEGVHIKSAAAKAWERDWPIFARGQFITGERFAVILRYTFGPGDRGDVDNFNKLPLDCAAKSGMFRNAKGEWLSDAWVKRLTVEIFDEPADRKKGPKTEIIISSIPKANA